VLYRFFQRVGPNTVELDRRLEIVAPGFGSLNHNRRRRRGRWCRSGLTIEDGVWIRETCIDGQ